jgi:hypothetical protein
MNTDVCSNSDLKNSKVFHVHAMKAYRGNRWRLMVTLMPQPLYPQEGTSVPTEKEAGWVPEPFQISCSCQDFNPGSSSL